MRNFTAYFDMMVFNNNKKNVTTPVLDETIALFIYSIYDSFNSLS